MKISNNLQAPSSFSRVNTNRPLSERWANAISKLVLLCVVNISWRSSETTGTLLIVHLATGLGDASIGMS